VLFATWKTMEGRQRDPNLDFSNMGSASGLRI
jgi:hypothetical protein